MTDYNTNDYRQSILREHSQLVYPPTPSVIRRSESGVGSTRSWAYSQNPTNPDPSIITSPMRAPRPLPDPYRYSQAHPRLSVVNADPPEEEEEEEEYNVDPPGTQQPNTQYGNQYETQYDTQYGGYGYGGGSYEGVGRPMSVREPRLLQPDTENKSGFVGGFVKGLKRIPRSIFGYGKKGRQGTFETDGTGMTGASGTTLPVYASTPPTPNPGPSTSPYAGRANMGSIHNRPIPNVSQPGPESRHRRIPPFSPPSQVPEQDEGSQNYEHSSPPPQFTEHASSPPLDQNGPRATVMVYQNTLASEPVPTPGDVSTHISSNNRLSRIATNVSIAPGQPPAQSQNDPTQVRTPPPVSAHPLPTGDYAKMGALSPGRTARTTITTWTSDEPSFSSELGSVQRFFYVLYHLPWASSKRVTVDYRPGVGAGGDGGGRGVIKKNATSWYRPPGASAHADLDLTREDGGIGSRPTSGSNSTALLSPIGGRRARRSATQNRRTNHHHHYHTSTHHHRRHRRRGTISTTNSGLPEILQRASSPLVPPMYPFQYPPYPYSIPAYPARAHSPQGGHSSRTPMYPNGGYAPYQPMAAPGVVILQSPRGSPGEGNQGPQGQVLAPVFMQVVPGAFAQEGGGGGTSRSVSPMPAMPIPAPAAAK